MENNYATELTAAAADVNISDNYGPLVEVKNFLANRNDLEILRHFCGSPIPNAPALLDEAIFVSLDLEWWEKEKTAKLYAITEVGVTMISGKDIKKHAAQLDLVGMLNASTTYHIRVLEFCHMRNDYLAEDAENNSLFGKTRFLDLQGSREILSQILDDNLLADGSKAPVILLGQSLQNDKEKLKSDKYKWNLDVDGIESVVHTINKVTDLVVLAGIRPEPPVGIDGILQAFNVEQHWAHNAANDTMYALVSALLVGMFQGLYPLSSDDYPANSSLGGCSLNDILESQSESKLAMSGPKWGFAQFCCYCEVASDHDADNCPNRGTQVPCQLCANSPGKANAKYRSRSKNHLTSPCVYEKNHKIPDFPVFLPPTLKNRDGLATLSRALYAKDMPTIGKIMYKALGAGRMGDRQVEEWAKLEWMDKKEEEEFFVSLGEDKESDPLNEDYSRDWEEEKAKKKERKKNRKVKDQAQ